MFEFHGWAHVRVPEDDMIVEGARQIGAGRRHEAIKLLRAAVNDVHDEFSYFDVQQCGNGMIVLLAHGLRNHRYEPVIELFGWVAENLPESYGLLYIHDDERAGKENEFRVWRLARGKLSEQEDLLLSPCIPTIDEAEESG